MFKQILFISLRHNKASMKKEIKEIITKLKEIEIDGESMQFILNEVGLSDQMHRQLVLTKPLKETEDLLIERGDSFSPIVFWYDFNKVKPQGDFEYLVCNTDGVIRVSYFDGINWGYLASQRENILFWSYLPSIPS